MDQEFRDLVKKLPRIRSRVSEARDPRFARELEVTGEVGSSAGRRGEARPGPDPAEEGGGGAGRLGPEGRARAPGPRRRLAAEAPRGGRRMAGRGGADTSDPFRTCPSAGEAADLEKN